MRLRLILAFVLIVLVSVSSVALIADRGAAREVRAFMIRGTMVGVDDLVGMLEAYYQEHQSWEGAAELLPQPGRGQSGGHGMGNQWMMGMMNQRLRLADSDGLLFADTANPEQSGRLSSIEMTNAIPLRMNGRTAGYLLLEGGMPFTQADEDWLIQRLNRAALSAGLIAGALAMLLALLLAYSLARPLRTLTTAAGRLAHGDLAERVKVTGRDEFAELGQAFNSMAASLQQAEASRRALTADIAHELRTPLAVQRAQLEAMQDGVYPLTGANLILIEEQNQLLTRLVDDLRILALADAGQLRLERLPSDFPALVQQVLSRFRPQAEARQIHISSALDFPPQAVPPLLSIDPLRIEQVITNLLSNALRYTPAGGQIECRVAPGDAWLVKEALPHLTPDVAATAMVFTIHDSGPGIPPEALPHIFERFYRADKARSRSEGGSGLGLAIARQLVEAHGGSLSAANHPQGGAAFYLVLPVGLA